MIRKLTREEALMYHRQMWTDMRDVLGDNPSPFERTDFKFDWCKKHFPNEFVLNDCFLCEYFAQNDPDPFASCEEKCLIDWTDSTGKDAECYVGEVKYTRSPISVILALPERKEEI